MLLGPQLADIVPHPEALQLFGEFGIFLMVRRKRVLFAVPRAGSKRTRCVVFMEPWHG